MAKSQLKIVPDDEPATDSMGFALPVPDGRRGRVFLIGHWSAAHINAVGSLFTVVDGVSCSLSAGRVDWLVGETRLGTPASLSRIVSELRRSSSPDVRLVVVDPENRWPDGQDCDVYITGAVDPGELAGTLWLLSKGFSVGRFTAGQRPRRESPRGLTSREIELLRVLCAGLGNDQIAQRLNISRSTVEFHLTKIFKKLDVSSRAEAIVHVLQYGIPV